MAVDNVGMDVPIKFGNSRLNGFRDIRGADFVSNEHWGSLSQQRETLCVSPKKPRHVVVLSINRPR